MTRQLLCIAILALLGGVYALKRRNWKLAFAGSIAAIFSWTPVLLIIPATIFGSAPIGILVVILITKSKGEFE